MDYLNIIFYFRYLKVFSFLMFVRIHGENFVPIPKVSYEHFQYGVRVTEDMILQNCTCSLPLPGPSPCFTVNTARNLVLLLCQFFQPEKCSAMCLLFFFWSGWEVIIYWHVAKSGFSCCNSISPLLWDSWENLIKMSARRMAGDSLKGLIKPGWPTAPTGEENPVGTWAYNFLVIRV